MIPDISIVIATLGGEELKDAVLTANRGTTVPREILICLPPNAPELDFPGIENVRVLRATARGQVAQRLFGFQNARCPLVLQMDDDVQLETRCLETLARAMMEKGHRASVGPSLHIRSTGKYAYSPPDLKSRASRRMYRILNGSRGFVSGRISLSGFNFAIIHGADDLQRVDWLPGGCLMHWRENLVKENYYPFEGKAYAEDLFHSYALTSAGLSLYQSKNAVADFDWSTVGLAGRRQHLPGEMRAMFRFSKTAGKNRARLIVYYAIVYLDLMYQLARRWVGRTLRSTGMRPS